MKTFSKYYQMIVEASKRSLILVDFQPEYCVATQNPLTLRHISEEALMNVVGYINSGKVDNVLAYFNGSLLGQSDDTAQDVRNMFATVGVNSNLLNRFTYREKVFGFLRDWLDDSDISNASIIHTLRYLKTNGLTQSDEIPDDVLEELTNGEFSPGYHGVIWIPEIELNLLKQFNKSYIGGGYRHQCFREITTLMNAFNIKYKAVNDFIFDY